MLDVFNGIYMSINVDIMIIYIDLWDIPWYCEHRIKRFDIAYVAETHQGDKLNFYREQTREQTYCIRLVKTDQHTQQDTEVCRCKIQFN